MRFIDRNWGWLFVLWFVFVMSACTPLACQHGRSDEGVCPKEKHDDH